MATSFTNQAALTYNGARVLSNVAVGRLDSALSVTKTAVQQEYSSGSVITYVVSIINSSDTALTGLSLSDDLGAYAFGTGTVQPLGYVDGSVMYYSDGVLQPAPAVSTADGLTISGLGISASGNATIVYSAQANEFAPLETGSVITNTVTVSGGLTDEAQATESVAAADGAVLSVLKSVSPVPVVGNGRLTYTVQLVNTGNTAVLSTDNAAITDTFDPILYNLEVSLNGTTLTAAGYSYDDTTGDFSTTPGLITVPAAAFTQDPATGEWTTTPGTATLIVSGTVFSA